MEIKEMVALLEKATGVALDEESIKGLVSEQLAEHLKALPSSAVTAGEDPDTTKAEKVTFSQTLGDIKRASMGQRGDGGGLKYLKSEQLVRVESDTKALSENSGAVGAYLVPTEESRELINLVPNYSAVNRLCRQVPMRTRQITFPTLSGGLTAYWVPETTSDRDKTDPSGYTQATGFKPSSDISLGQMVITAHTLCVKVAVSNQLLDDSDPSVDSVLRMLFAETLGTAFDISSLDPVVGLDGKIVTNVLQAGAEFNFDDILGLIFACYENAPSATSIPILGHTKAEKVLMSLKDANGQYLYKGPTQPAALPTVWGEQFVRDPNILANLGPQANETKLYAGDFANSAFVGSRQGIVVKTNPWAEPYFSHNQTCFLAEMRVGFQLSDEKRFASLAGVPTN
ncbi:MAG: phage major capsid protein [Rhodocyclales bacterium]|nr:phage major capsid protein [Rhodocyclales bacterium]